MEETALADKLSAFIDNVSGSNPARPVKLEGGTIYLAPIDGAPPAFGSLLRIKRITSTITDPATGAILAEEGKTVGYAVIEKTSDNLASGRYFPVVKGERPGPDDRAVPVTGRVAFVWPAVGKTEADALTAKMQKLLSTSNLTPVTPDEIDLFVIENGLKSTAQVLKKKWRDLFMESVRADIMVEVSSKVKGKHEIFTFSAYLPNVGKAALVKKGLGERVAPSVKKEAPAVKPPEPRAVIAHEIREAGIDNVDSWSGESRLELWKKFNHSIVGALFADGDGDGSYEFVYATHDVVFVRTSPKGDVLWKSPKIKGAKINSLMASDLDGDGNEEIYVNYVQNSRVKSFIASVVGGRWGIRKEGLPLYFSGSDHGRILAQKSDMENVVSLDVFAVNYDGSEIALENLFSLPYDAPVGLSPISNGAPVSFTGINRNRILSTYGKNGKTLSSTLEIKAGSNETIDVRLTDEELQDASRSSRSYDVPFLLLGIKIFALPHKSRSIVAVPENRESFGIMKLRYPGSYKRGRVTLAYLNDEKNLEPLSVTPYLEDWVITSVFTDPGSKDVEIFVTANYTGKKSRGKGRIYRLVILEE